ncbi:hypothetical protein PFFCH_04414 [Plasmodium falciparum FCH/4]|uniref:J domain-containing protein n=1 Tax=Plasmodium falciparum FCH/4 TaxID=1036724 RepID=A0A024VIA5_PLAFA|nr:hypothetical protein PFFCH_04414 [Plasmodium falciparum FCH/4]
MENCQNNHYNIILIQTDTQRTTINSRLLAQTQNKNPHYHNDPELKEIIDKLNEEAIKKYQQTHDPYRQLKEVVEKNGTKYTGGNDAEPMSSIEKDLLETYEEVFGQENHIMLKSGMYPNDDEKSSRCECTDINNTDLTKRKAKDKYLKHLKHRCIGGICSCSVGSFLLTMIGLYAAKKAAVAAVVSIYGEPLKICISSISIFKILQNSALPSALKAVATKCVSDAAGTAASAASAIFDPCEEENDHGNMNAKNIYGNLGYNGSSSSGVQFTDRCSRNLYGETLPVNPYADSENPIVVSQVFGLPFEKPTFTLESPPDIDHTNILGFNEKFMTDVNRYRYSNNYEAIPHISEFNPLIVDKVLFDYNEKVDNLGRSGGDIIKKMQTLWDEIMDINKRKYDFLKAKLQKTYSQYKVQYDMPKEAYESKWTQCIKLIDQGGENLEERLNSQFKNWYRQKYLNLEEYRRLTVLNQIAWKALSNQIQYSCRKIMNSDISSFKHINELKSLEHRAAKAAEAEMKKRAQKPKKKKSRRGWLCCGGGDIETVEPQQEEPVQTVQEQQVNEYGDILPSLRASITNSAINYYDTVKDGVYLDHETSDALYTDEDLLFDLEKQKYMDMLDTSEEEYVEENEEEHTVDDEHVEEHTADDEHLAENYYPYQRSGSTVFHNFRKVNEAYQVLGDIDKKRWYNKYGYDGIKQVNFMNPSIFYLLSSLEKFKDFTGTPQIVTLLRFFFEKRLSMNDLENKSEHLLKFMEQYQKEREAHVSEYLLNILQPCIAGDSKWNVPIITKLEGLKGSRFDIPILESLRWIFKHVAKTHLKKSSKSAKKLQQRTQANKQELANINNNLMSTLKEYLGSSEQMNSITYNFENINSNVDNGNQSKNISDLSYTDQKEILEKIVSYIVDISLYDIENTALNAAEQLLSDNSVDEKTLKKRAQSLKKLSSIMERYAGGKRNDKKAKKYDTQDVVGYIMHGISTINKEMKNQNENVPEHVQHNAEANVEHDAEENNFIPSCYENVYSLKKVTRQNIHIRSLAQCLNTQPISKKTSVEEKLKEKVVKENKDRNEKQTNIIDESEQENSIDLSDYTNIGSSLNPDDIDNY